MSQSDFVNRGQALVAAGQFQEAVKVCRLGLLGRPTTVEGRVVLGQALLALKRYDEVLAEMRVALELDHTSLPAQLLKGEALLRKGDADGAYEILTRARQQSPNDAKLSQLLTEAERAAGKPAGAANRAGMAFLGEAPTKHYPNHQQAHGDEESGPSGSYTRPTSLQAPAQKKKSNRQQAEKALDATPSPAVLAVGDRSGTVEVDPDAEAVEIDDDDLGELAAPPSSAPRAMPEPRGYVQTKTNQQDAALAVAAKRPRARKEASNVSSVELIADDLEVVDSDDERDFAETDGPFERPTHPLPGPGTKVRNAVQVKPGPLTDPAASARMHAAANRPTAIGQPVPPMPQPLAQMLAAKPAVIMPPTPQPLPPPPMMQRPLASALPTQLAMPMPQPLSNDGMTWPSQSPPPPINPAAASRPTMVAPQDDRLFGQEGPPPAWARATVAAAAAPPPPPPPPLPAKVDAQLAALMNEMSQPGTEPSASGAKLKTGMRKTRSRAALVVWVLLGVLVIGGGVFAGFQIRNMRLRRQIADARDQATERAKADTWSGWTAARESLANIVAASSTPDNQAALARTRALLAFEFGDGLADAKKELDALPSDSGLDGELATAYIALANNDPKAAKVAAERVLLTAATDPGALYVAGQAALLAGDAKTASTHLKAAIDGEPRPLYAVGLAKALAASGQLDDALGAVDRALAASTDNPGALIERGTLLAQSGRIVPGNALGGEIRGQLEKVVGEGGKAVGEQPRGVSPSQVAFADLALAQVDFARGDAGRALNDVTAAAQVQLDDPRFAEEAVDTLYRIGKLDLAKSFSESAIKQYSSRRARITLAATLVALGKPNDALDVLAKITDLGGYPQGLVVRGQAHAAAGDLDDARTDFDLALKKVPNLEGAVVGKAWLDLAAGQLDEARALVSKRYNAQASTAALGTAFAAILRATGDRDKARTILEKVVAGPPSPDTPRAQLELARILRDSGDFRAARTAYAEASKSGGMEARLETALLAIEVNDLAGGRDTIEAMLKEAGDHAPGTLLLEGARARMLGGDDAGASTLLDAAQKATGAIKWQLERERARLALRKGDYTGASQLLTRAIESCGDDVETFLLAAEVIDGDDKQAQLAQRLKALWPKRLEGKAEAFVVEGLYALTNFGDGTDAASAAYTKARDQLLKEKASDRRQSRAHYGLAIVAISRKDVVGAKTSLELALSEDPSLYNAYLYSAQLYAEKNDFRRAAEAADKAVTYNPDSLDGWLLVGTYAAKNNNGKRLADAITRAGDIQPNGEVFKQLEALRKR